MIGKAHPQERMNLNIQCVCSLTLKTRGVSEYNGEQSRGHRVHNTLQDVRAVGRSSVFVVPSTAHGSARGQRGIARWSSGIGSLPSRLRGLWSKVVTSCMSAVFVVEVFENVSWLTSFLKVRGAERRTFSQNPLAALAQQPGGPGGGKAGQGR